MRKYGLYVEDFYFLLEQQNYKCKICSRDFDLSGGIYNKLRPQLDHCHETSAPRGLLCVECNIGLGMFKDNPDNLQAALLYLGLEPHTPVSVSEAMSLIRGGKMPKHENYDFTKRREAAGVLLEDTLDCPHCSEMGFISQAGVNRHIGRMHKEIRLPGSRRK